MTPSSPLLHWLAWAGLALSTLHPAMQADVVPAALFSDHAVLQQGVTLPVWGTADEGEKVSVEFAGNTVSTVSHQGRWMVHLPAVPAGGPLTMTINGRNHIVITDLLVGEVWLCSGQSNMEMKLGPSDGLQPVVNWREAVATADQPQLRFFNVPRTFSLTSLQETKAKWERCTSDSAPSSSAVAFFFGRALLQSRHVPIGLIHSSWGGSYAEAWMSREGLEHRPEFADALTQQAVYLKDPKAANAQVDKLLADWYVRHDAGSATAAPWSELRSTPADWKEMAVPGYWEKAGLPDFDGVVWFRREFELPAAWAGHDTELHLGSIDDDDTTWVNGVPVGATRNYKQLRVYPVPASALHLGRNVVTVRVLDTGGDGGLWGNDRPLRLVCPDNPSSPAINLEGSWRYQVGVSLEGLPSPPRVFTEDVSVPGALYNGMIAPLHPYALRGVIWYQGEANSGRAREYRTLFPAMIADWRQSWGQGDFPFLFVQIAPWRGMVPEIREAQLLTSLRTPNTAMAVTLDVGDAQDIHPPHKQPVGERLALAARALAYGEKIEYSGPICVSADFQDGKAVLHFSHLGGGLVAPGGELIGFTIAGADKVFVPAQARIESDTLVVSAETMRHPVAVRYAWANVPVGNLYNRAGLPASPFRTDVD
jgi:sialate O-acetylesterase